MSLITDTQLREVCSALIDEYDERNVEAVLARDDSQMVVVSVAFVVPSVIRMDFPDAAAPKFPMLNVEVFVPMLRLRLPVGFVSADQATPVIPTFAQSASQSVAELGLTLIRHHSLATTVNVALPLIVQVVGVIVPSAWIGSSKRTRKRRCRVS